MSYQLTMLSVDKVKNELTLLANGKLDIVYIDTNNPKRLAYLLQQGMAAATELNLPLLSELRDNWKICLEKTRIKCEKLIPIISAPYLEFPDVSDLLGLLDTWIKNKDLGVELRFPSISRSPEIDEWLDNRKSHEIWKWKDKTLCMMLIVPPIEFTAIKVSLPKAGNEE